jgi:isoleucyl-tRNA synthetase
MVSGSPKAAYDMTEQKAKEPMDYKDTVFLPKTDFPMKAGLPQKEPAILAKWQEQDLYHKLREARAGREKFILHDGPPYANGDMHIGHALNHILKDMVCRTQSLLGKDAPYVPGWDCHGLPIEWKVEEQYRKKKLNKDEVPVKEFRAECRAYAQHWVNVQREQVKRLGVLGHWDKPYLTMDFDSEATIVSELLKFAESGQLYRGAKPVMWSPVEKTALAEAEVEYEDITSTQIDVAFEITESPIPELVGAHAVIWTTTPWTIPVNQAIAYGPDVEYVLVEAWFGVSDQGDGNLSREQQDNPWLDYYNQKRYLIARELMGQFNNRLDKFLADKSTQEAVTVGITLVEKWSGKGSDLAGTIARHPMAKLFESPLPFRGGDGGGVSQDGATQDVSRDVDRPHPNPSPEGEGFKKEVGPEGEGLNNINPQSPLAEFFLRPRPFLPGDFVTTDSGTGLVHMAPDHGEDDFDLCKAHGIEPVFAVEGDGKYRADWGWLGGQGSVINPKFNAPDGPICSDLREAGGLLAASADYSHSYPHSWRSKAKVIYRCTPQWFVPMDRESTPPPTPTAAVPLPMPTAQGGSSLSQSDGEVADASAADGGVKTLRQKATQAIADTRWVPEKGRNRIGAMVEGRPDWVLSRQRAWGVPITLFVDRKTGQYLNDTAVNARIVEGIKAEGVDAWCAENAKSFLGETYNADDYEQVFDILDVWFDSGCTHVFTLESGKWPELLREPGYSGPTADLYLEGSDQHRGWFQSSLLQSCGTRGHAPYKAVLTHGFTMDQKGLKMSKSVGNTVDPLKVMENSGADIIRLWALSVDFTEDHRIGDEILRGVGDQYRKLRNTFRYMLGALEGFSDAEKVPVEAMPELERYVLHLLADMDAKLRQAVDDFDYNSYVRLLTDFANEDLSAFFFDIRKDCLYCDVNPATRQQTDKRKAYRTVLDILFHAMVRYAAPVLVFTAEEIWSTRFPDAESVHLLEWPILPLTRHASEGWHLGPQSTNALDPSLRWGDDLVERWSRIRYIRTVVSAAVEPLRRDRKIGSSLEAGVGLSLPLDEKLEYSEQDLAEICIVSRLSHVEEYPSPDENKSADAYPRKNLDNKCGRCWRHLPEVTEDGALCGRCEDVLHG